MSRSNVDKRRKKEVVVAVSGGFDPLHLGHIRHFREAKKLGDKLIVILNNDNWLRKKKGFVFMSERERKAILEALADVDRVVLTRHPPDPQDMSVCRDLRRIRPDIYANGGDRTRRNIPETAVAKEIDCALKFNVGRGGKIQSSSWILANYAKFVKLL